MKLLVDGREAYAYTGGKPFDPALPCVVFVHGACHDHSPWTLLARWLAHHGHGVLAVDLPGHRRSAGPPLPDVEALATWILALLDAAGVARAALVGHSMGALIALEAAAKAPERCTHLVMIGMAYPMKVSDALLATAAADPLRAMAMVNAWSISTLATKPGFPGPGNWHHGSDLALRRLVQASAPGVNLFHHDFDMCNRYAGGMQAAARRHRHRDGAQGARRHRARRSPHDHRVTRRHAGCPAQRAGLISRPRRAPRSPRRASGGRSRPHGASPARRCPA